MDENINNNNNLMEYRYNSQREQSLFSLVELSINSLVKTIEVLSSSVGNTDKQKSLGGVVATELASLPFANMPNPFSSLSTISPPPSPPHGISNPFQGMEKEDKELMLQMMKIAPEIQKQIEKDRERQEKENKEWKEKVLGKKKENDE